MEQKDAKREFKKQENLQLKDRDKSESLMKKRRDNQNDLFR